MIDLIKRDDALALLDQIAGGEEYIADRERLVAALPATDPAAIREAALREAAALCDRYPYVEGVKTALIDLIGEKK